MRISAIILVLLTVVALASCGGTSRRNNGAYGYSVGGMYYNGANFGTTANGYGYSINNYNYGAVSSLAEMVAAAYGVNNCVRLPDFVMSGTALNNYMLTVNGTGATAAGDVSEIYAGRNSVGDLLIVAKISNGVQVVGYNVILSFCIGNDPIYNGTVITTFST